MDKTLDIKDLNSLKETLYLIKSPKNALRLSKALKDLQNSVNFKEINIDDHDIDNPIKSSCL